MWLLALDLDKFSLRIKVAVVAEVRFFLLIIHIGFRKFRWISWISIFRPTRALMHIAQCETKQNVISVY